MIKTEKTFRDATEGLRSAGYPAGDLLPLIPPEARLDERAGVEPKMLGKIPGRFIAGGDHATGEGTWTGLRSWADGLPAKDQNTVLSWPTRNVGLRANNFPGLDVDTNTDEARDMVRGVAEAALNLGGPIRTRAGAPRLLIPLRLEGEPFGKIRMEFNDGDGKDHAVEMLARNQQYVVAGFHPSGDMYEWSGGGLAACAPSHLPSITKGDAEAFFDLLRGEVEKRGWTISKGTRTSHSGSGEPLPVDSIEPCDPQLVLAALRAMPNTAKNLPARDDLVRVFAETKAALGRLSELYRPEVMAWAEDGDFAGVCDFEGIWDSLHVVHARPTALFERARRFGFVGDVLADFVSEVPNIPGATNKPPKWLKGADTDSKSKGPTNLNTIVLKLAEAPEWQGVFGFDEFGRREMVLKHLPHPDRPDHCPNEPFRPRPLTDSDITQTRLWLQRLGGLPSAKVSDVQDAIGWRALRNSFHPVRDYFGRIEWDGVPRLNTWLVDYLGAKADVSSEREALYLAEVGRKVLVSAVARAYEPGCKVDTVLVLEGEQGVGKSSMVRLLVPDGDWHSETPPELGTKDAALHLVGKWIIELSELASVGRASVEHVKSFVSTTIDKFRRPYGRMDESFPRQCIFIGTTNAAEFLRDDTGGRRFLPVKMTKEIDRKTFAEVRDQLWAEAKAAFRVGEPWHITGEALDAAKQVQSAKAETDPWDEHVVAKAKEWADARKWPPTVTDLLTHAVNVRREHQTRAHQNRVGGCLRRAGWHDARQRINGKLVRYWWHADLGPAPLEEWEAEELRGEAERAKQAMLRGASEFAVGAPAHAA